MPFLTIYQKIHRQHSHILKNIGIWFLSRAISQTRYSYILENIGIWFSDQAASQADILTFSRMLECCQEFVKDFAVR